MNGFLDDLDAMALSTFVVLAVLAVAEFARRRGLARSTTRKIVHVGIGTWVVPTFLIFDHRLWAVVPPACFVVVNALSFRYGLIRSVEGGERNLGTIVYPLTVATALAVFWGPTNQMIGAAAILVMAWGDAAGSLVGRRHGRHVYRVAGHPRSWEGTLAVAAFGLLAVLAAFAAMGVPLHGGVVAAALLAALVAAAIEAVSLWGFDNVLVPVGVAAVLWSTRGGLW